MREYSLDEFYSKLRSGDPVPGGGGAAATMGAAAAALCGMVGNLTTGKKKYQEYQEAIEAILEKSQKLTDKMLEFSEKDAEAFAPLAKAYGIPKDEPGRDEVLEKALVVAAAAPLEILEETQNVASMIDELMTKGSRLAISDVACAAAACKAAAQSAAMNVFINTKLMKNREYALLINEKSDAVLENVNDVCDKVYKKIYEDLRSTK